MNGHYEYQVVFAGNGGYSFIGYDRLFANKSQAREMARKWDGTGLRYGARVKRVHVKN